MKKWVTFMLLAVLALGFYKLGEERTREIYEERIIDNWILFYNVEERGGYGYNEENQEAYVDNVD